MSLAKKKLVSAILKALSLEFPSPKVALNFKTPFELLAATILSAQSTDVQVNKITEKLFAKYRSLGDYARTPLPGLEKDVSSVNFYRNKARNIQQSARMILESHGGEVPRTMAELIELPGVARKTANIVLSGAYGLTEGIAVDTHVLRLSERLGLTLETDPVKVERDLMAITPKERWSDLSHLLILHGRKTCKARKPAHGACSLSKICPSRDM